MIQTDPVTAYLMAKFVRYEHEKDYEHTLHRVITKTQNKLAEELGVPAQELVDKTNRVAGELVKTKLDRELRKAVGHLAETLALACLVSDKPTPKRRKKLKRMAERAAGLEGLKLEILNSAVESADYEYIAEVLINIGREKASKAAVSAAAGPESAGE